MEAGTVRGLRAGPLAPVWRVLGDEQLARAAGDGNDSAFAALYARYRPALRSYCASILLDQADAEDAVQATMLKAMRALPARDGRGALRPWLYRIAHNEAIDMLRRRRTQAGPGALETCFVPGPDADVARRERLTELVADLRTLPQRQGAALLMRELSGLSYDDVALALDMTPAAARQAVFEARSALHDYAAGRETACAAIQRSLSDGDRRRWRSRTVRAHLRACEGCRSFEHANVRRGEDLALLPPFVLQGSATAALTGGLLSGMAGIAGGGASGIGTLAGLAGGTAAKSLAGAAATIVIGGAALGGGLPSGGRPSTEARAAATPPTALAAPTPIATRAADGTVGTTVAVPPHHLPAASRRGKGRLTAVGLVEKTVKRLPAAARRVAHVPASAVGPNAVEQARRAYEQAQQRAREAAAQAMRDAMRKSAEEAARRWSTGAAASHSSWEQAAKDYAQKWSTERQAATSPGAGAQPAASQDSTQESSSAAAQQSAWRAAAEEWAQRWRTGGSPSGN